MIEKDGEKKQAMDGFDRMVKEIKTLKSKNALLLKDLEEKHGLATECFNLAKENKELRTRVAELERQKEGFKYGRNIAIETRDKQILNLQGRVAELEKEVEIKGRLIGQLQIPLEEPLSYQKMSEQLSTLLKASEGMEKALDRLARLGNEPMMGNSIGNQIAQEALADFRAVKEGK